MSYNVAILTISDSASKDASLDKSGPLLRSLFENDDDYYASLLGDGGSKGIRWPEGLKFRVIGSWIAPDETSNIQNIIRKWIARGDVDWVVTTGGTGFGKRDCTPETISPLIDRPAPGLVHLLLSYSLTKTPLAALSRPVAGALAGTNTLITTLPGSPKAVREGLEALAPVIGHALELLRGGDGRGLHDEIRVVELEDTPVHDHLGQLAITTGEERGHRHKHSHSHTQDHSNRHSRPTPRTHDPSLGVSARHRSSPFPLISLEEALAIVKREIRPLEVITRKVDASLRNYVLAQDVIAPYDLPQTPTTNVDGYAIDSYHPAGVYPVRVSSSAPLTESERFKKYIYRVNTGSPLPPGMNAVVMVEDTKLVRTVQNPGSYGSDAEVEEAEVELLVGAPTVKIGENVRQPGSDVKKGELVLERGALLSAKGGEVGALAFVGVREVEVVRRPIVALMSTGNEIVDLQDDPETSGRRQPGFEGWTGIYDTNRPSLQAILEGSGYEVLDMGIVGDSLEVHTSTMRQALQNADLLITTGGSSMGSSDLLKPVIERHLDGRIHFGRVSVKPGKPTTFATVSIRSGGGKREVPIFALPGNPASALVMFYIFVLPAIRRMSGWAERSCPLPRVSVELMDDMPLDPRPEFHRVCVRASTSGKLQAFSTGGQRSSRIASLAGANGFVHVPALKGGSPGEKKLLKRGETAIAVLIGEVENR